ncbi:jerky protein homolog-like [Frankliniella occidentalis]|uniref:Jerky protein homolog-like n=1 Tax=Frankliniella occidentalis TaxID=133901 RepID=A0A6J1T0Y0_FRAOC|nr:jerky protein homolog-like [Frankliniella occidentalis]
MIGKSALPRCWRNRKDLTTLPVVYTNQHKAWMDSIIFLDWFGTVFVPEVQRRQAADGITGPVVLILDNAPCHPDASILNDVEPGFSVMYMPPNCTSPIQPIDQGAIETMKRLYRRGLLAELLLNETNDGLDVTKFQKKLTVDDCSRLASKAWSQVKETTLARVWRKLLGEQHGEETPTPPSSPDGILEQLAAVNPAITPSDMTAWLQVDHADPGHGLMTDDEILQAARREDVEDEEEVDDPSPTSAASPAVSAAAAVVTGPSKEEALTGFDTVVKYLSTKSDQQSQYLLRQFNKLFTPLNNN